MLPTGQISFSDLRRVIGPNGTAAISLGQCRPSYPPAYGKGIIGVTDTDIKMSQFRGKSKLNKGFTFRAFKGSEYTFKAGSGGAAGATNSHSGATLYGGGGGGGGILVNGAGGGAGSRFNGGAGEGYGAGGGAPQGQDYGVGRGANGFVYLYLNNSEAFFTSSTDYSFNSSGTLKFIMIGGGGASSAGYGTDEDGTYYEGGNGGNSGNLKYGNIPVTSETSIKITVGGSGETTSIIVNGVTYSADGGGGGVAAGGGGGTAAGNAVAGGAAGTGSQKADYFNAAITSIPIMGGYFADDISLFNTYSAFASGTTTDMTNISSATNSIYTTGGSSTNFSIEWVGKFYPPTSGSYTFYLDSDDASYLWIDSKATSGFTTGNADINNGGIHPMTIKSYTIELTGGTLYPMRIQYGQKEGGYDLKFSFKGPSIGLTNNFDGYIYN